MTYSIEWPGQKTTNAATLVRNLTAAGVRIDGELHSASYSCISDC